MATAEIAIAEHAKHKSEGFRLRERHFVKCCVEMSVDFGAVATQDSNNRRSNNNGWK
jgi:hypothetical protein